MRQIFSAIILKIPVGILVRKRDYILINSKHKFSAIF